MHNKFILFLLLFSVSVFSQGEANIWYFGKNAGLDFNSGSPVALTNGQLVTEEGCATISNSSGQLLFYTDGITVYNRNHTVMINGSGLMGHSSSAQSATIVQMPGSINLYYIFTTDNEHDPDGFRYSIVDMNLDGGNGAVTSNKNVLIYAPTIENLGVTKHANGTDFWIITHDWNNNSFKSYQLSSTGLNTTPVITNIGLIITGNGFSAAGMIKVSPSGSKLAITSVSDFAQLFNFNTNTGVLSNELTLITEPGELMGVAFSPDESLLYIGNAFGKIYQFNLNASDIPNSITTIFSGNNLIPGQMQLGPDNKIYVSFASKLKIGVINNPNVQGTGCDLQTNAIDLAGKEARFGLPSFNQSFFFAPSILLSSTCEGENSTFNFSTNQTVLSATWNFGDGNTSNAISPIHTYATSGVYSVSVTVTTPQGTGTNNRTITILPRPTLLLNTITLKQCDDNNDGFSAFNLKETQQLLVASTAGLTFTYYETQNDADDNLLPIANPLVYTNQIVSNDVVFVRIENADGCYRTAQINLNVSTTSIPSSFQKVFTVCDDMFSGSNTDGIATFNFSSVTSDIQALYPVGQLLTIKYYKNLADALAEQNTISDISNYTNIGYPNTQNIYVRVDSQVNNECLGLGHHITLNVEVIPFINDKIIRNCDDNQDGIFGFNTTNLQNNIINGLTNVTVSYKDQNGNTLSSPLPNPFVTTSQTITVRVTNNTSTACYDEATIQFIVDDLPEAFPIATALTTTCDDEVNPLLQDGLFPFNTSTFQATILGSQTGMIVNYYDANGVALPSPLPNPFTTGTQTISVEVINPINTTCKANLSIPFVVKPTPKINTTGTELVCSNNPNFIKIIDAGLDDVSTINNFTYQWYLDGNILTGETNYSLTVNAEGIYTVDVTNSQNCLKTRTITVTASNIATIENITITDLSQNNSVIVSVSGSGDYEYSLDGENYQTSNIFYNLESGNYTVYVKDNNGCGIVQEDISLLGIPNYFTPNGDGYNDTWNIKGISNSYNAKTTIHIFDRYGKLLKQISPLSNGWDGTYNGIAVSSSDYWYVINLEDGRTFKGHFTLKR